MSFYSMSNFNAHYWKQNFTLQWGDLEKSAWRLRILGGCKFDTYFRNPLILPWRNEVDKLKFMLQKE